MCFLKAIFLVLQDHAYCPCELQSILLQMDMGSLWGIHVCMYISILSIHILIYICLHMVQGLYPSEHQGVVLQVLVKTKQNGSLPCGHF